MFLDKKYIPDIVVAIILIAGIGLLAYPTIGDYINALHSSKAIGSYVEKTKDLSKEEKENLLREAREYNESLVGKVNRYYLNEEEKKRYAHILDITKTGIMAYVEIPKLNIYMPVYHGTDEGVLQIAAGHLPGSSLPVGGENTHSLISGHRGLPSAKLFTDIDKLKKGDLFFIHVFDEVLAYKVNQIKIVLPDDVETLEIEKGKDYVTLITCTPYGVNSHRLLVRGERTVYKQSESKIEDMIKKNNLKYIMLTAGVILALIGMTVLVSVFLIKRRKRRKLNEK